jgi:hypothetical protein
MRFNQLFKGLGMIIILSILTNCSYNTVPTATVNFVSGNKGTITMRAIGFGINTEDAINDAEKNAMNVLLFRGLPESEVTVGLIGTNESAEMEKHPAYFSKFYNGLRYKSFIMSSIPTSDLIIKKGSKKSIAVDIKINYAALKKDLEQSNLIRQFGY